MGTESPENKRACRGVGLGRQTGKTNSAGSGVGGEASEVFPRRGGRMKVVNVYRGCLEEFGFPPVFS